MATCNIDGLDPTKKFNNQYGWINNKTGHITYNQPAIISTLTHNIDPIARQIAAMTPLHELTHRAINERKIFMGTPQEIQAADLAAQGLMAEVESLAIRGNISKEIANVILPRMKRYAAKIKAAEKKGVKITYDEFLTVYTELMALTGINSKKWNNVDGMRQVLSNIFKDPEGPGKGQWSKIIDPFNTPSLIKSFLANFLNRVQTYKKVIIGDEEKEKEESYEEVVSRGLKEAGFSFSESLDNALTQSDKVILQQAGDQINKNVIGQLAKDLDKDINQLTKADWQKQGLAEAYMYLIAEEGDGRPLLDNLIRMGLRKGKKMRGPDGLIKYGKNITGNDVYGVPIAPLFLEDVGQQLYRRTIQRFNPAQNDDFGGFLVSELMDFRIAEVVNQYAKRYGGGREVSQERVLGQSEDLKLADTLISDELSPEEYTDQQLALEREKKAIIVKQKGKTKVELPKRSIVRQDMSTIKAIEDKVKKLIQDKLPSIIEEVLASSKDITSIDQLVAAIEKKLGDEIIKKLGGTIGMKKGEFVVPEQWLDFVKNEYAKLVKAIPGKIIKKSYQDLFNIIPTGEKIDVTNVKDNRYRIDKFTIDQPTKAEWVDYFARPATTQGKPVSVKNKYIARQRGLAGIVVREMVKDQMREHLADPKNIQAIAEKLNIQPGQVILKALQEQINEEFDFDINEQKDNLASIYSFSDALDNYGYMSVGSALDTLSVVNRAIFDSYVSPLLDEINKIYKKLSEANPNQYITLGRLELDKAWNEIFTPEFLKDKKLKIKDDSISKKALILNSFKNLLNHFNPVYKDVDSGKIKKQELLDFLYEDILAADVRDTLKSFLGLGKGALKHANQKQRTKLLNAIADALRELLDKGKFDEALAMAFMVGNTFNQSGKAAKGGEKVKSHEVEGKHYDDELGVFGGFEFGYVPSDSKVGGLRYSIFEGNENFGKDFLQPLFEQYGIVIETDLKSEATKKRAASYTIQYVKDGILEDFSKIMDVVPQAVDKYAKNLIEGFISTTDLKASENYSKVNMAFLIQMADYFKKKLAEAKTEEEKLDIKNSFGMFLMSANGDMRSPIRASARVDSMVTNIATSSPAFIKAYKQAKTEKEKGDVARKYLRYEHNPPARTTQIGLAEYVLGNWNKFRLNDMFKTSGVSIITKEMDNQINLFHKDTIERDQILGDSKNSKASKWSRYFFDKLYGAFNNEIIYYKKKGKGYERVEIGEGQIEEFKSKNQLIKNNTSLLPSNIQASESLDNNFIAVNALNNYTKAQANALKYPVDNKGISIFDFDDTIVISKSKVLVYAPYYPPGSTQEAIMELTPAEFAEKAQDLESQGAAFDFSEFNKVVDGKKGPLFTKLQKAVNKFGNENVFILTARPQAAAGPIKSFLEGLGIDLKIENIVGLEDGTPGAKANWVAQKAAEGYNDFYFTDDAYSNVKAVQEVLDIVDVKGKTHQAQYQFSESMDSTFNEMLERKTGIARDAVYSQAKAELMGKRKRDEIFISSDADDFEGLMYRTLGKGKEGDMDKKFLKKALYNPFGRAMGSLSQDRVTLMADFKQVKKVLGINTRQLRSIKIPGGWNAEQAIRVYIWNKQGMDIPGLSQGDIKTMVDYVNKNINYKSFAEKLVYINKGDTYMQPKFGWLAGTIATDIGDNISTVKRKKYLEDTGWKQNKDIIFSENNLNKLEAAFGKTYRTALEDMLERMETGRSRTYAGDSLTGNFIEWINGSIGAIMFFNTRSAILQTISAANFINWTDNNILTASKAFANQPQFWKDFNMLFNSEFLIDRRSGLRINLNESDLAEAAKLGGFKGAVSYMLKLGFLPTQIMDSFAIASGGATFYRNRLNTYLKKMGEEEAHNKTIVDWREIAETSQQSARADKISQQQAGPLGRIILAFANTPMQYTRLMKKAFLDLKNGRGDWKTNLSKIIYYGAVQNFFFNAMQQALFALGFGDPDEDEKTEKYTNIANGMADSILRGTGFYGAAVAAIKNGIYKFYREKQKKSPKYENVIWELVKFSPPLGSKISKVRNWGRTLTWDAKEIKEKGFSLDNPALMAWSQLLSAGTNIPLDRVLQKIENIRDASSSEAEMWQRLALFGGWRAWELDFDPSMVKSESLYNLDINLDLDLDLDLDDLNLNF